MSRTMFNAEFRDRVARVYMRTEQEATLMAAHFLMHVPEFSIEKNNTTGQWLLSTVVDEPMTFITLCQEVAAKVDAANPVPETVMTPRHPDYVSPAPVAMEDGPDDPSHRTLCEVRDCLARAEFLLRECHRMEIEVHEALPGDHEEGECEAILEKAQRIWIAGLSTTQALRQVRAMTGPSPLDVTKGSC